jgi:transcriptional regulator with XRE-family HTH domain
LPSVHKGASAKVQAEAFTAALSRLASNLRTLRERSGVTQEALAAAVGVDTRHIVRLESGAGGNPSLKLLSGLAAALAADVAELLRDAPAPNPRPRGRPRGRAAK